MIVPALIIAMIAWWVVAEPKAVGKWLGIVMHWAEVSRREEFDRAINPPPPRRGLRKHIWWIVIVCFVIVYVVYQGPLPPW